MPSDETAPRIFMLAGEVSGDIHGGDLAREIRALDPSIRLEGAILSADILDRLDDAPGQRPTDFGMGGTARVKDEIARAWSSSLIWSSISTVFSLMAYLPISPSSPACCTPRACHRPSMPPPPAGWSATTRTPSIPGRASAMA